MELLAVSTNPTIDRIISVPSLKPHNVHRSKSLYLSAGGKGLNVGRAAKTLNIDAEAAGFLGGCSGQLLEKLVLQEGLPASWLRFSDIETKMSHLLTHDDGDTTVINEPGPKLSSEQWIQFRDFIVKKSIGCRAAILAGSVPPGVSGADYYELCSQIRQHVQAVFIDTPGHTLKAMVSKPQGFCIKVNREELQEALSINLPTEKALLAAAETLLNAGAELICITLGKDGAVVCTRSEAYKASCIFPQFASSVGSGDSFMAGLSLFRIKNLSLEEALRWACACGAANTKNLYPADFDLECVKELLPKVETQRLK